MLREANLDERILAYKSFESLAEVAKGPANKVFIPSNAIETLGTLGAIGEIFKEKSERNYLQMIQEKNNKSEEEKWYTISLFNAYILKILYISMYKEGDAVKSMQLEYMGRS